MEYNFKEVEKKWQSYWQENKTYRVEVDPSKPKYYVLDMFPYPSGAGLHVGHPLGYIASDIYSRYKHLKGFNVLHPMGYDAYGLPAEQYAIQTGQHPAITTEKNIRRYREQMDKIGFSFDWDREIRTCDPEYYKWTQWTFIQMFNSFYCYDEQKAMPITELVKAFEAVGTQGLNVACGEEMNFTAEEWKRKSTKEQQEILLNYRLAYLADTMVNWCPQLGTVLANDEVKEGLSLRGGYPVVQKKMRQWSLRVSAYAQRLLDGLDNIDWSDSLKDIQRNWIGRSQGADVKFDVKDSDLKLEIFTTRPDTIFGVSFMVLAPESDYVKPLTTPEQADAVAEYLDYVSKRTERERQTEVKKVTGVFTGSYAINPFTNEAIPIWISEYVLSGYGTGAIMAVPGHDSRDYAFAKHFNLPIVPVVDDVGLGGGGELHLQLLVGQASVQAAQEKVHDGGDVLLGEGLVVDDLVQPVEELRPEGALEQLVHLVPGLLGDLPVGVDALQQILGAQVGGEDEDGVLKVHRPALAVGDAAVVQDLEQDVEHVGMGLFHLVKEDHGVGLPADGLGELAALLIAHIAGRGPDEPGDGELLHVLRHVDAHQVLLAVKEGLGQGLGQLGLAHAGGAQEEEGANGFIRVGDARPAAEDGLGHQAHRLVLAHHPLVEDVLQVKQLLTLPLHEPGDGDSGPPLDDAGDLLLGDLVPQQGTGLTLVGDGLLGLQLFPQLGDAAVLELGGAVQIVLPLGGLQLGVGALQLLPELLHLADGVLLVFPLGLLAVEAVAEFGHLLFQSGQTLL